MILDPRAYWSLSSVAEFAEVSESTARRIVAQPDFPSAIRVYEGAHPRWKAGDVMDYIDGKREAA